MRKLFFRVRPRFEIGLRLEFGLDYNLVKEKRYCYCMVMV